MNTRSGKIVVNDATWNVNDSGRHDSDEVVLLVHGYPLDHSMWRYQIEELSKEYRIIAPDLAGFGNSELNSVQESGRDGNLELLKSGSTMALMADELASLLDAMQIKRPVTFCGLSMGGYVGWEFFRRQRSRISRLIACDTRSVADTEEIARARAIVARTVLRKGPGEIASGLVPKLFAQSSMESGSELKEVVDDIREVIESANPLAVAAASYAMAARPDSTGLLPQIDIPVLVVVGEHDVISTPEEMKVIADSIPHSRFAVIKEAGHMAPLENAAAFNHALREFTG